MFIDASSPIKKIILNVNNKFRHHPQPQYNNFKMNTFVVVCHPKWKDEPVIDQVLSDQFWR